jgi:carbon monoxide dehydrogenase subunit G
LIFSGEDRFAFDIQVVWAALHNTELLVKAVPGCRSMTPVGGNSYVVALSLGVAAVRGEYEGRVRVIDKKIPTHYRLEGEGSGAPGFVKVKADCWLEAQGVETLVRWNCDAQVGGLIAGIGGRVLTGTSRFLAKQFFNVLREEIRIREGAAGLAVAAGGGGQSPMRESRVSAQQNWFVRWFGFLWSWSRKRSRAREVPDSGKEL